MQRFRSVGGLQRFIAVFPQSEMFSCRRIRNAPPLPPTFIASAHWRSGNKKNPLDSSPTILQQKSIYFDTPGWDLSKRGLSLRIRQSGNERIQTVKVGDGAAAGSFTREEWEQPVAGDAPVLDDPQIRDLLAGAGGKLAPLFEVHVKRHRWNVMEGDATIEVALDLGKVVAEDRQAPLCEIEFEKKAGAPTALFALARKVDQITPAHLGVLSKAERGYRLLGAAPGAVKAIPTSLTSDVSPATAFARIAAACLRQFRLNEAALGWSRDAEALHQARVALRPANGGRLRKSRRRPRKLRRFAMRPVISLPTETPWS